MPTILLVRHGQASFGGADYDELSELGREQSLILARELAGREPAVSTIVSGSLRRQRDTATPLADALGQAATVDPRWNEYDMDQILAHHAATDVRTGGEQGQRVTSAQFQDLLEAGLRHWVAAGADSPAPESWPAFSQRIAGALADLAAGVPSGTTGVAFTSGGVVAALCGIATGLGQATLIPLNRVAINCAITKIVHGRRGTTLVSFNEHTHLERAAPALVSYR